MQKINIYIIIIFLFSGLFLSIPIVKGEDEKKYELEKWSWTTPPIIYIEDVDPNNKDKTTTYKNEVIRAIETWVRDVPIFEYDNSQCYSVVAWLLDKPDENNKPSVTVKWTDDANFLIKKCDSTMACASKNEVWLIKNNPDGSDLSSNVIYNIVLHEFGHVWGLKHSEDEKDIMYKYSSVTLDLAGQKYESSKEDRLSERDIKMIQEKFKGFCVKLGYDHEEKDKLLIVKYSIASKVGNLNVKIERRYFINDEDSGKRPPGDPKGDVLIGTNFKYFDHTDSNTKIEDVTKLRIMLYISESKIPNVKNAKLIPGIEPFIFQKEFDNIKDECNKCHAPPPDHSPVPPYSICRDCHFRKGSSSNSYGLITLSVFLLTTGILTLKRNYKK